MNQLLNSLKIIHTLMHQELSCSVKIINESAYNNHKSTVSYDNFLYKKTSHIRYLDL